MMEILIESKKYGNKICLIDDEDYELIKGSKLSLSKGKLDCFYVRLAKDGKDFQLHRYILELNNDLKHKLVDHIDHNGLNNCKNNLRICDSHQNSCNRRKSPGKTSKYIGVLWVKRENKWKAKVKSHGIIYNITTSDDEIFCAKARDQMARYFHGDFAELNFPNDDENVIEIDKVLNFKSTTSSKYIGVQWRKSRRRWCAKILIDGKSKTLGSFKIEIEAAIAYNNAAVKYFGEKAKLNIF